MTEISSFSQMQYVTIRFPDKMLLNVSMYFQRPRQSHHQWEFLAYWTHVVHAKAISELRRNRVHELPCFFASTADISDARR